MEVEVTIPSGCFGGSELIVEAGGQELIVEIPVGLGPGDTMLVMVPDIPASPIKAAAQFDVMYVVVPDGVCSGDDMIVEAPDGRQLSVVVPRGLTAGDSMEVTFPLQTANNLPPSSPSIQLAPAPAPSSPSADDDKPNRLHPAELSGSDSSDDEGDDRAKFGRGQPVEVLRSDGHWTLGTVTDYEDGGCTYTVQLADGRCKYFVEEADMRIPRFLLLSTGNI